MTIEVEYDNTPAEEISQESPAAESSQESPASNNDVQETTQESAAEADVDSGTAGCPRSADWSH